VSTILVIFSAIGIIFALVSQCLLVVELKTNHQEEYDRMGRPPAWAILPSDILAVWPFTFKILCGEYRGKAPDAVLGYYKFTRGAYYAAIIFALAAIGINANAT
jgi:hypothetical protein